MVSYQSVVVWMVTCHICGKKILLRSFEAASALKEGRFICQCGNVIRRLTKA